MGDACQERICSLRGYCFIPDEGVASEDPEKDSLIGQRAGDYLLHGILGVGGFGRVYRALQLPVGMPAAVKLLGGDGGSVGMAALKLAKFEIEAQALARLSHPNIVRLYHYGRHRGAPYLAMELIENANNLWSEIENRAADERPFSLDEVQAILLQVLAALEAAHDRQIIHRDIKPENIMLQSVPGHGVFVKVLDFGLAKFTEDRSATSMLLGTPAYMASEQITRGKLGPWTDFYALGVLTFELLTGVRPYGGADVQATLALKLDGAFDPWMRIVEMGFPDELRIFFAHALATEPEARYATAADFREGLVRVLDALRAQGETYSEIPLGRLVESTPLSSNAADRFAHLQPTRRLGSDGEAPRAPGEDDAPRPTSTSPTGRIQVVTEQLLSKARRPHPGWHILRLAAIPALAAVAIVILALATNSDSDPSPPIVPIAREPNVGRPTGADAGDVVREPAKIPSGRFVRGSAPHDPDHRPDETLHEVVISNPFVATVTEVTQRDWARRFETRPWRHANCKDDCPVDSVTWWDAVAYANALSEAGELETCYRLSGCRSTPGDSEFTCRGARFKGPDCRGWRLPTEAEWEYLARAQSPPPEPLEDHAWFGANAPRSVASKSPNAWGLYDLFGNVREWVHDAYGDYPGADLLRDPAGPGVGTERVIRGGGYRSPRGLMRAAARDHAPAMTAEPDLGFRLVRTVARDED